MTSEKLRVAVDVDEVLFLYLERFVEHHNQTYGTNYTADDFFSYDFQHVIGESVPETVRRVHEAYSNCRLTDLPVEGSVQGVERLSAKYALDIVTARNPKFEAETRDWLDEHFAGMFENLFLVGHPLDVKSPRTKAEVCRDIGAFALVDDSAHHVNDFARLGVSGVLFGDYPWNRTAPILDGVVRCNDWLAVVDFFDGKAVQAAS